MFSTGYGTYRYVGTYPAWQMTPHMSARNRQSRSSEGTFNSVLNIILRAVAKMEIRDLLDSIFDNQN